MGNDLKKIGNQTIKLNSKPKIISTLFESNDCTFTVK